MKNLIYQVNLGQSKNTPLYTHCIHSVKEYAQQHNITHIVQTQPILRIQPDPFTSNRSKESTSKHGGYLPIYEKENAFDLLNQYDNIAIIDADIYIRPNSPNIFEIQDPNHAFAAVLEQEMPTTLVYKDKIRNYARMQYNSVPNYPTNHFFNMGMMLINQSFIPYLKNQSASQFLNRLEFKDFVDGKANYKWSTDQTLLNYFINKYNIPTQHLSHHWNGLYTANTQIEQCHFVHFFLKDKLPTQDPIQLMKSI